jgi:hypothetical protein
LFRAVNDFKKGYQPRTNIVKDEEGDLITDCHNILASWRAHFSQLLNLQWINHTVEPLVPEPNAFEVEMAIEKLKRHNSPGIDQVPAELFRAAEIAVRSINLLFLF